MSDIEKLAALKARIPNVKCKGFCWRSCTGIHLTSLEKQLIEDRFGIHIRQAPPDLIIKYRDRTTCPALDGQKRCRVHEDKQAYPTVCSAFGATEHMPCLYGCEVEGEVMAFEDYKLLDADINDVGGTPYQSSMDRTRLRQLLSTRTGRKRFRDAAFAMMAGPLAWWAKYVKRFPEGEMAGGGKQV